VSLGVGEAARPFKGEPGLGGKYTNAGVPSPGAGEPNVVAVAGVPDTASAQRTSSRSASRLQGRARGPWGNQGNCCFRRMTSDQRAVAGPKQASRASKAALGSLRENWRSSSHRRAIRRRRRPRRSTHPPGRKNLNAAPARAEGPASPFPAEAAAPGGIGGRDAVSVV
jgi:hypothetical protein